MEWILAMVTYDKKVLVELVKACGQELIDRADDIVGSTEMLTDFDIWITIPKDKIPKIRVDKEIASKNSWSVLMEKS